MSDVRQLTPLGSGGVAVLGLCSDESEERLRRCFDRPLPAAGQIAFGSLRAESGEILDEVLVVRTRGGALELHLHGSQPLVDDLRARLGRPGPAVEAADATGTAAPLEERAWSLAASAPTAFGARILIDQAEGALRREIDALFAAAPAERAQRCAELAARGEACARLFRRTRVALVGPVNAGKSTLFNLLVGAEEALVSDEPGTTRDALGAHAVLGLWPAVLVDTAGERQLHGLREGRAAQQATIEAEGMRLARAAADRADITLEMRPALERGQERAAGPVAGSASGRPRVIVWSRCAESLGPHPSAWPEGGLSALEAPDHARRTVAATIAGTLGLATDPGALWRPGDGVPFEPRFVERLHRFGQQGSVDTLGLDSLLAAM